MDEWLQAACCVSFLYDCAGRSEDAQSQTWELITAVEGGGLAEIKPGKTGIERENVLTLRTMELLDELGKGRKKEGQIFRSFYSMWAGKPFETANALRKSTPSSPPPPLEVTRYR